MNARRIIVTEVTLAEPYAKPVLVKHANLKAITFDCPDWSCSIVVPPPPAAP